MWPEGPPAAPSAPTRPAPARIKYIPDRREAFVTALQSADIEARLAALLHLPAAEAAAQYADIVSAAARSVFGQPGSGRGPPAAGRSPPWFRPCRALWDARLAALRAGKLQEARRLQQEIKAHCRCALRAHRARRSQQLLSTLRGDPRRFWTKYSADGRGSAAVSLAAAHLTAQLAGAGLLPNVLLDSLTDLLDRVFRE